MARREGEPAARLRRRYLVAMGLPAAAASALAASSPACTPQGPQLVSAPLYEGDAAALLASATSDAGRLVPPTSASSKSFATDPPEPVPPRWQSTENKICREDLDAPDRAELPSPFDACPKRGPGGGQFSAKTTRAERANNPDTCCYIVYTGIPVPGRALRDGTDDVVVAEATDRDDWRGDFGGRGPRVDGLAPNVRAELARAWLEDAAFEHASIASFARFTLDAMALGAPAALLADACAASRDEIEHARLCYALASAYAGRAWGPGVLALDGLRAAEADLASFARATFVDGCVGETVAALEVREGAAAATDPVVRAVLLRIARDEERHAELAWRAVGWAVREGGAPVAAALRDARSEARVSVPVPRGARVLRRAAFLELESHGRISASSRRRVAERALCVVIEPCVSALLARRLSA